MQKTFRILPEVYLVGSSEISNPGDCMVYLVDCKSELALIDAGVSADISKICKNIRRVGLNPKDISTLFVTHSHIDHVGGAASFRKTYGCKTVAHELDSDAVERANPERTGAVWYNQKLIPCKVDIKLSGSEGDVSVGNKNFRWIHTPGHTPEAFPYFSTLRMAISCSRKMFMVPSCLNFAPTSQTGLNP